ncbi:GerMN domain-containing protein [Anaerotignum sp.]|uniref:GerMN domain-containing protein n=1 Tax=Anaerotignum sp. TaxID=2039241 RepID=UPI00373582AB
MKKKKWLLHFALAVIACIILLPCLFLLGSKLGSSGMEDAEVYYLVSANNSLKEVRESVAQETEPSNMAFYLLERMKEDPKKDGMVTAVPAEVEFLSVRLEDKKAIVDVSAPYLALESAEEVICRSAIVWTVTSLEMVDDVELTVEGRPLRNQQGEEIGSMNRENVRIDGNVPAETTEYAILKLYFTNADGTDFQVEDRVVEVNANQAREKTILEQLIAGPLEKGYYPTISADTKIRDVTTTKDGICYVNLSQDFLTKSVAANINEVVTVYSIVNSLCELEEVDKVQFLMEGEKIEDYKGVLDFSTPFTAVESLQTIRLQNQK